MFQDLFGIVSGGVLGAREDGDGDGNGGAGEGGDGDGDMVVLVGKQALEHLTQIFCVVFSTCLLFHLLLTPNSFLKLFSLFFSTKSCTLLRLNTRNLRG